jgi:hypothetical protein
MAGRVVPQLRRFHNAAYRGSQVGWDEVRASWENLVTICSNGQVRLSDQRICVRGFMFVTPIPGRWNTPFLRWLRDRIIIEPADFTTSYGSGWVSESIQTTGCRQRLRTEALNPLTGSLCRLTEASLDRPSQLQSRL